MLQEIFAQTQLALEVDPHATHLQAQLAIAEIELKEFMAKQPRWMMEVAQLKWIQGGHQCPKSICATFKQQSAQKNIVAMQDANREV